MAMKLRRDYAFLVDSLIDEQLKNASVLTGFASDRKKKSKTFGFLFPKMESQSRFGELRAIVANMLLMSSRCAGLTGNVS